MEFLLILLLIVAIAAIMPKPDDQRNLKDPHVVQKKACPPHQWFWQEITDQDGVKQGERIVCKVCGPINSEREQ